MATALKLLRKTILQTIVGLVTLTWSLSGEAAAGYVSIDKDGEVWWFKAPDGKHFLSVGANHVESLYWQSPNNQSFVRTQYGPDLILPNGQINEGSEAAKKWAANVSRNFETWGFNTFGFHNSLSASLRSASKAFYVVELDLRTPWGWNMSRPQLLQAMKRRPTDIFSEDFRLAAEANADEFVKPRANDPLLLGYAYSDGPPWTVSDGTDAAALEKLSPAEKIIHPWVLTLMSQPANSSGKQAWLAGLKERYPSADKAGATYGISASNWGDLAATTAWRQITDSAQAGADSQAFLGKIIRQWYAVRQQAIRRHDTHHLILGDKLNINRDRKFPEELSRSLHLMNDYVDVINIQYYAPFSEQRETLAFIYKECGKPILNGDTAVNPLWEDNPLSNTEFYGKLGKTYADHVTNLFSLPYFIGWHHCGYMRGLRKPYIEAMQRGDQPTVQFYLKSKHTFREGFISELEEPITPLLTPLSQAIRESEQVHAGTGVGKGL